MALAVRTQAPARSKRPELRVVPARRRWPAVIGFVTITLMLVTMMGAAVFHTQLAQRQLRIDDLENSVQAERERFDELRRDRAVLRSPGRIASEAAELEMVRGETSRFIEVDPGALARQLAAAGVVDDDASRVIEESGPLDQFRDVKSVSAGQP